MTATCVPAQAPALPPTAVVVLGLAVHLVLTYSVIDIHFQTPVVRGIAPEAMPHPGPARRIVVVVADGLRSDKLFSGDARGGSSRAPFLRSKALGAGRFGVSHARPPTESRPGHVAMLAGFYEDPSALFSGWQANPVAFDSVFNHSAAAWGFGSPDVVPMFQGQGPYVWDAYAPDLEDFGRDDLAVLDVWAFNRTRSLLAEARAQPSHPLRDGPALLFVHLLGLDSNGHAHGGPHSPQYLDNIALVDRHLAELVSEVEALFPDGSTAYLVTSDHGMSDQASHGDGAPENTETPYVLWGAGVAPRAGVGARSAAASVSEGWGMGSSLREDLEQAQLTPLISALLGTPTPVNSIGTLPLHLLGGAAAWRAHAAWAAARQLLAAHDRKAQHVRSGALWFVPHAGLERVRGAQVGAVAAALAAGEWDAVAAGSMALAAAAVEAIGYLQRYDQAPLMVTVTLGFLGWMGFLTVQLLMDAARGAPPTPPLETLPPRRGPAAPQPWAQRLGGARSVGAAALAAAWAALGAVGAPATYYAYAALPCLFWSEVLHHRALVARALRVALSSRPLRLRLVVELPSALALLVAMALGFRHREVYAALMPLASLLAVGVSDARGRAPAWRMVGAFATAGAFALAPTRKRIDTQMVLATGATAAAVVVMLTTRRGPVPARGRVEGCDDHSGAAAPPPSSKEVAAGRGPRPPWASAALTGVQLSAVCAALLVAGLAHKGRRQPLLRALAWAVYVSGPLLPLVSAREWRARWRALLLGLLAPFILVSTSWEPLFFGALAAAVDAWLEFDAATRTAAAAAARGCVRDGRVEESSADAAATPGGGTPAGPGRLGGAASGAAPATPNTQRVTRSMARAAAAAAATPPAAAVRPPAASSLLPSSLSSSPPPLPLLRQQQHDMRARQPPAVSQRSGEGGVGAPAGLEDVPAALLFLLLIQMAFFGQGNTATIASFDLASVYRLTTLFNPYVMAALLLGKLLLPFLAVAAGFTALAARARKGRFGLYLLVLVASNVMALHFFFDVKSTGSWMEIGSSLGFYGILNAQVVVVLLLLVLAQGYVRGVAMPS